MQPAKARLQGIDSIEFLLQLAKAKLQEIDSKEFYSFTMKVFSGHPLQSGFSRLPYIWNLFSIFLSLLFFCN